MGTRRVTGLGPAALAEPTAPTRVAGGGLGIALPTPATLAIFRLLKAGERVFLILLRTKTVVHVLRGAQPLFHALCGFKTLSGTLLGPTFHEKGLRGLRG